MSNDEAVCLTVKSYVSLKIGRRFLIYCVRLTNPFDSFSAITFSIIGCETNIPSLNSSQMLCLMRDFADFSCEAFSPIVSTMRSTFPINDSICQVLTIFAKFTSLPDDNGSSMTFHLCRPIFKDQYRYCTKKRAATKDGSVGENYAVRFGIGTTLLTGSCHFDGIFSISVSPM